MSTTPFRAEALEHRRHFAAGDIDATFNLSGRQTIGFTQQFDSASAVARQADGRLILAGFTSSNTTGSSSFALTRLTPDGTLDDTFSGGRVVTSFGAGATAQAVGVGVLADGKIIAGGYITVAGRTDFALARYNADGSLDATYGTGGRVVANLGSDSEVASAFLLAPDGKVYLGGTNGTATSGFLVARFDTAGALDTTWGNVGVGGTGGGVTIVQLPGGTGAVQSLALTPTGGLVAAGFRQGTPPVGGSGENLSDFALARLTAGGQLDATFNATPTATTGGTAGLFINDFAGNGVADEALGVAVQADGNVVAVGFSGNTLPRAGASRFAILRLAADGTLDPAFATAGKFLSSPASARFESLSAVSILPDGRILAAGTVGDPNAPAATPDAINSDYALLRLTTAGALDTTFGAISPAGGRSGLATADVTGGFDEARSIIVQPDGRIVLAGFAGNASQQGGGADFGAARLLTDLNQVDPNNPTIFASVFGPGSVAQGSPATFTISLSQAATTPLTFTFSTADGSALAGTDYTTATGQFTIAAGTLTAEVTVATLASAGNTAGRSFSLTVTPPAGVTLSTSTAAVTVLGATQTAPLPVLSISNVSVNERLSRAGAAVFTVTLDRVSATAVTVNFATANSSATAGTDYTATTGTLTIPAGQRTGTITVAVAGDTVAEANESFVVNLSAPVGATFGASNQGIATVVNADFRTVTFGGRVRPVITDEAGRRVTVSLAGPGTGTLFLPTTPANANIDTIDLAGTTTRSTLLVSVPGRGAFTTVSQIRTSAPLATISAATTNLVGDLSAGGTVTNVFLRSFSGGTINLPAGSSTNLRLGAVTDGSITSAGVIRSLLVTTWADTDANDTVTARDLTSVVASAGNFAARLVASAGSIGVVNVRGAYNGGGATSAGNIRSVLAGSVSGATFDAANDITAFTSRGAVSGSVVRAGRRLNAFSATRLVDSRLLAGLPAATTSLPLAQSFVGTAGTIGRVLLRGERNNTAFSNSIVAATTIDSAVLNTVNLAPGAVTQGVVADNLIRSVSYLQPGQRRATLLRNLSTGDNPVQNFTVRIV